MQRPDMQNYRCVIRYAAGIVIHTTRTKHPRVACMRIDCGQSVPRVLERASSMPESWWDYVTRVAGPDATQKDIAERSGIEQSSISRWKLHKNTPNADAVVRFARAYGDSPIAALIAARYLQADEVAGIIEIGAGLSDIPTRELLGELLRRIPPGIARGSEDDSQWPEGFFEGSPNEAPSIRRRQDS